MKTGKSVKKNNAASGKKQARVSTFRMVPLARAMALSLVAGGMWGEAMAQHQPFSGAWFAQKGAAQNHASSTGLLPNGQPISSILPNNPTSQQSQAAREKLQGSINNLNTAAQAIALQQALQARARATALAGTSVIPDGLVAGGLKVDENTLTQSWINAEKPTQSAEDGRVVVDVKQTADKAILSWETFNVGRNTTVNFDQKSNWTLLSRVNDPNARPSEIQGQINADGAVYLINRNGILFGGSSQVNVRNLVASAVNISNEKFSTNFLTSAWDESGPAFAIDNPTQRAGAVTVEAGAQIEVDSAGRLALFGGEVRNDGTLLAPDGQVLLAAGQEIYLRASSDNAMRGLYVVVSEGGKAVNNGYISAEHGNVTLAGHSVDLAGIEVDGQAAAAAISSSSNMIGNGSITLQARHQAQKILVGDVNPIFSGWETIAGGTVNVGQGVVLSVLPDLEDTRLVSDEALGDRAFIDVAAGKVVVGSDALLLAPSGEIKIDARSGRGDNQGFPDGSLIRIERDAVLDVSGTRGVQKSVLDNFVQVELRGAELADSPAYYDVLYGKKAWVDIREQGTFGDPLMADVEWIEGRPGVWQGSPLFNATGYVGLIERGIGELTSAGGDISLVSVGNIDLRDGSLLNVSGGTLEYTGGYVPVSHVLDAAGNRVALGQTTLGQAYTGVAGQFTVSHSRWGVSETFNTFVNRVQVYEAGYQEGAAAGTIHLMAPKLSIAGDFLAVREASTRERATTPVGGSLIIGNPNAPGPTLVAPRLYGFDQMLIQAEKQILADEDYLDGLLPDNFVTVLAVETLEQSGISHLGVHANAGIRVADDVDLDLGDFGSVRFNARHIEVDGRLRAANGNIRLETMYTTGSTHGTEELLRLGSQAVLDVAGRWSNALDGSLSGAINGGTLMLTAEDRSAGSNTVTDNVRSGDARVVIEDGAVLDVSGGARIGMDGRVAALGNAGSIAIVGHEVAIGEGVALLGHAYATRIAAGAGGSLTISDGASKVISSEPDDDLRAISGGVLKAGSPAPMDVRLSSDLVIPAGDPMPIEVKPGPGHLYPDLPLLQAQSFGTNTSNLQFSTVVAAAWQVPAGMTFIASINGNSVSYTAGRIIPAGATITQAWGALAAGVVLPSDAFPEGLIVTGATSGRSIPIFEQQIGVGHKLPFDHTLVAGAVVVAGSVLPVDVNITPPGIYQQNFFETGGFANYRLVAGDSLTVADGSQLVVTPQHRLLEGWIGDIASGTRASEIGTLAVMSPALRGPSSLELSAGYQAYVLDQLGVAQPLGAYGHVDVGTGALLDVGVGGSINLTGRQSLYVDGTLNAPGGEISLNKGVVTTLGRDYSPGQYTDDTAANTLWLGSNARLLAPGVLAPSFNRHGLNTGTLMDGGSVTLNVTGAGYLVTEAGSLIDVSGGLAQVDRITGDSAASVTDKRDDGVPMHESTRVWSNAGTIHLAVNDGAWLDGDFRAGVQDARASAGTFLLKFGERVQFANPTPYGNNKNLQQEILRREVIFRQQATSTLPEGAMFGDALPTQVLNFDTTAGREWATGAVELSADQLMDAGFGTIDIESQTHIVFGGDVELAVNKSLVLNAGAFAALDPTLAGQVTLSAPHVHLGDSDSHQAGTGNRLTGYASRGYTPFTTPVAGAAHLTVNASRLLEFGGRTVLQGFDQGSFISAGDLRFTGVTTQGLGSTGVLQEGSLKAAGDLALGARQLYPSSGMAFTVSATPVAGVDAEGNPVTRGGTLTILPGDGQEATLPLSVGGRLTLQASHLVQEGVLLAPLGQITLDAGTTGSVTLADGSITDVSLQGRTVPYGTLLNGQWYQGIGVEFSGGNDQVLIAVDEPPAKAITISADSVDIQSGAMLDLSGGGEVPSMEFTAGTGGSRSVLAGAGVYAIVAGEQSPTGTTASGQNPAPVAGARVWLDAVPGLDAGWYTLLPAEYALLPGGFRVELVAAQSDRQGISGARIDGGHYVSGRFGSALDGSEDARVSTFLVLSGETARHYSEYREATFSQAFARDSAGASLGAALPADAGRLSLVATSALGLAGSFDFSVAEGGQGGQADIAAQSMAVIANGAAAVDGYALSIEAGALNAIGAQSLLLGGHRETGTSDSVELVGVSDAILIATNESSALVSPEILLLTNNGRAGGATTIVLADGAVIRAEGDYSGTARPLIVGDDTASEGGTSQGALLVLSNAPNDLLIQRHDIANASGSLSGSIDLGTGVSLAAKGAILFDAVAGASIPVDALITARSLELAATAIHFGNAPVNAEGFIADAGTLSRLSQAERLVLRSYGTIDLHEGTDFRSETAALVLDAAALRHQGSGMVRVEADQLTLRNTSGTLAAGAASTNNTGDIDLDARQLTVGAGDNRILGVSLARLTAQEVHFEGVGTLTTGSQAAAADLLLTTPFISAATGADHNVTTTGVLRVVRGEQAALEDRADRAGSAGVLHFVGDVIEFGSDVRLPAGSLTLEARQDLTVSGNAQLDVSGRTEVFFDQERTLPSGNIVLVSQTGNVRVDEGSLLDLSDPDGGGELTVTAPAGSFTIDGGAAGGKFTLDAGSLPGFGAMQAALNEGGFAGARKIRLRSGDAVLDGTTITRDFSLIVDQGGITVTGTLDASGATGGSIELAAADDVVLVSGSRLTVAGEDFDGSGKGGSVFLSAGANRIVDDVDVTNHAAVVDIQAGSLIDLGVASAAAAAKAVTLDAVGSLIALPAGNTLGFPEGTPGSTISSTVAATIAHADGSTQTLAANTGIELPPGATLTLLGAGEVKVIEGVAGVVVTLPVSGAFDTYGATTLSSVPVQLEAPGSSVYLAGGTPVVLPGGMPGDNIITTTSDSVSVTTVGDGTQVTVTAGKSALQLSAGSSVTLLGSDGGWEMPVDRVTLGVKGQGAVVTLTQSQVSTVSTNTTSTNGGTWTFVEGLPAASHFVLAGDIGAINNAVIPDGGKLAVVVHPESAGTRTALSVAANADQVDIYFPEGTPEGVQLTGANAQGYTLVLLGGVIQKVDQNMPFSVPAGATLRFEAVRNGSLQWAANSAHLPVKVEVTGRQPGAEVTANIYGSELTITEASAAVRFTPARGTNLASGTNYSAHFLGSAPVKLRLQATNLTSVAMPTAVRNAIVHEADAGVTLSLDRGGRLLPRGSGDLALALNGGGRFDIDGGTLNGISAGSVLTLAEDGALAYASGNSGAITLVLPAAARLASLNGARVLDLGGGQAGTLHLRAPQNAAGTDLNVRPIAGNVLGAAHLVVEGYKAYDLSGGTGLIDDAVRAQVERDGDTFVGNSAAIRNRLLATSPGLSDVLEVSPGAEIINANSDLPATIDAVLEPDGVLGIPSGGSIEFVGGFSGGRLVVSSEGMAPQTYYQVTTVEDGLLIVADDISRSEFIVPTGVPIELPDGSGTSTIRFVSTGYAILPDGSRQTVGGLTGVAISLPPGTVVYMDTNALGLARMAFNAAGLSAVLPAGSYEFAEGIQVASLPAGSTFGAGGAAIKVAQSSNQQVAVALSSSGTYRLNGVVIDSLGVSVPPNITSVDQITMSNPFLRFSTSWLELSKGARVKVDWLGTEGMFRTNVYGPDNPYHVYDADGNFSRTLTIANAVTNIQLKSGETIEMPENGSLTLYTHNLSVLVDITNNTLPDELTFGGNAVKEQVPVVPLTDVTLPSADLLLASDWDLSNVRFGTDATPGILTLRAAGNVIFNASLSDGFAGGDTILNSNLLLDDRSWSYRVAAGADFSGAGVLGVKPAFNVDEGRGQVILQAPDAVSGSGNVANGGRGVIVRTGTGRIDMAAAHDILFGVLRTNGNSASGGSVLHYSGVYTAGRPASIQPGSGSFVMLPDGRRAYGAGLTLAYGGGDITLNAQRDVLGERKNLGTPMQPQLPGDWLLSQGAYSESSGIYRQQVAWGPVYQSFRDGVATLGGGNLTVQAGRDVSGLNASVADAGVYQGATPDNRNLLTVGGGDMVLSAVRDVNGVNLYAANGAALLNVGRNLGAAPSETYSSQTWYLGNQTTYGSSLAIGSASVDLRVRGDVALSRIYNPIASFMTYDENSALKLSVLTGDITLTGSNAQTANVVGVGAIGFGTFLPGNVELIAFNGDISIGRGSFGVYVAPAVDGDLTVLARHSLQLGRLVLSDADPSVFATPETSASLSNVKFATALAELVPEFYPNFDRSKTHSASLYRANDVNPVRLYAVEGDITGAGQAVNVNQYNAISGVVALAKTAEVRAGRDIVNLQLIGQNLRDDQSTVVQAGRDILLHNPNLAARLNRVPSGAGIWIGGPGLLEVTAGRNMDLETGSGIQSVGNRLNPFLPEGTSANTVLTVGAGPTGPDYAGFADAYLNPGSLSGRQSYVQDVKLLNGDSETVVPGLLSFMRGQTGDQELDAASAWDAFQRLPDGQRQAFIRSIYFAESQRSGIKAATSGSYNDGYLALTALFPVSDRTLFPTDRAMTEAELRNFSDRWEDYQALLPDSYGGDLSLRYSQVRSYYDGSIEALVPFGAIDGGLAQVGPDISRSSLKQADALGIVALRGGNVSISSYGDVIVNQSRIFAVGGGTLSIWSSEGDINAGKGAKTALLAPPPRLVFDPVTGGFTLELTGAATGAGIATLITEEGQRPGDVYLMAPHGTVDAGDAGIRVSGNFVLAAANVRGLDNIQVEGTSLGVPVNTVNVGALTSASAAANSASQAAQDMVRRGHQDRPSVIRVEVLGFGNDDAEEASPVPPPSAGRYDPESRVQVLGHGAEFDEELMAQLTPEQRQLLK